MFERRLGRRNPAWGKLEGGRRGPLRLKDSLDPAAFAYKITAKELTA